MVVYFTISGSVDSGLPNEELTSSGSQSSSAQPDLCGQSGGQHGDDEDNSSTPRLSRTKFFYLFSYSKYIISLYICKQLCLLGMYLC